MKIGILLCGKAPPTLAEKYGEYDAHFARLLGNVNFEYVTWKVVDNDVPSDVHAVDGWLITGSKHGAYEDHLWIEPLENFLREAYRVGVPIIGVCFGHQILAQALGGKVEKYEGGWSAGRVEYTVESEDDPVAIIAWHQDQVTELPPEAKSFGSTPFCKYAFVSYGDKALTIQPHPEFTAEFARDLMATRGKVLPPEIQTRGTKSLEQPLATKLMVEKMTEFFMRERS